jgi:hypothetical protein
LAKVLLFNIPAYGHVNPTLPIVRELVQRGHQVVYYDSVSFEEAIQATGAEFRPYPDSGSSEAEFASRIHNLVTVSVFVLEETIRLLPFCLDAIEQEGPDLVMFDSIALWGMQAARLKHRKSAVSITTFVQEGVPGLFTGRDYLQIFRQAFANLLAIRRLRRQLVNTYGPDIFPGSSILPCKGDSSIVYTSREFQPDTPYIDGSFHFVGPSILAGTREATEFPWERLDPGRTRIYLSLGTLYNKNLEFYRTVFRAFSDHPGQFIISVGRAINIGDLGPVPRNFLVQAFVPQLDLLQKVDLFITHGGMNSVNEALYYGVPLIIVPQQIEQALNGRQVARHGAGVVLADSPPYGRLDPGLLRRTVDRIFADPAYRHNAGRLSRSFHEAGGFERAASVIMAALE